MKVKQLLLLAATLVVLLIVTFVLGGKAKVVPLDQQVAQQVNSSSSDENATPAHTVEGVDKEAALEAPIDEATEEASSDAESENSSNAAEQEADQPTEQPVTTSESQSPEQTVANKDNQPKPEVGGNPKATETKPPSPTEVKATPKPTETPKDSGGKGKTDEYLTDPVPEGKPQPVEWQDVVIDEKKTLKATLLVTAATILNNLHLFNEDKLEVLPSDGVIYAKQTVTFHEGESVFDVLLREMKNSKIHMEFVMTPIYNSHYIEGINNLYEFDCGELSGWMYKVNGWFPNYGASRYQLKSGDEIEWMYTCDLGRDIGGSGAVSANE